jgi:hypothetical protein
MISLTRREFDAVSSALLEALADAKRGEQLAAPGRWTRRTAARRDPARARPALGAMRLVAAVH